MPDTLLPLIEPPASAAVPQTRSGYHRREPQIGIVAAVAALCVFALYGSSLHSGFIADDHWFVRHIGGLNRHSLAFFSPFRHWFFRPVFLIYFSALRTVFGASSVAMRAVSLILHALNITLLFCLVRRLMGRTLDASLAALLFLLYPLNREAATWISSASTLLAAGFGMVSVLAWMSYREKRNPIRFVLSVAAMVLALLSKEDAIAVPAVLMALDLLRYRRSAPAQRRLAEYAVLAAVTLVYVKLDMIAYHLAQYPGRNDILSLKPGERASQTEAYLKLLLSSILPLLANINGAALIEVAVIPAAFLWSARRNPPLLWLGACCLIAAIPMPVAAGPHAMSNRFTYLPAMFLCSFAACGALALWRRPDLMSRMVSVILFTTISVVLIPTRVIASNDPVTLWEAWLMAALPALLIAGRVRVVPWPVVAAAVLSEVASQAIPLAAGGDLALWIGPTITIAAASAIAWRLGWWVGALTALLFWDSSLGAALLFVALAALRNVAGTRGWVGSETASGGFPDLAQT